MRNPYLDLSLHQEVDVTAAMRSYVPEEGKL